MTTTLNIENIRESKKCLICNSQDYNVLYKWNKNYYDHDKYETSSWDGRQSIDLRIVQCANCGLVYTNPSFKKEYLNYVYPEDIISIENRSKTELLKENKWNEILRTIDTYIEKGSIICDVGTRYGVLVEKLKQNGYNAFGIDLNEKSVNYARKIGINNVFSSDINNLDKTANQLEIDQINGFILDDVLEHLVHPVNELKILSKFQNSGDFIFLRQMDHDSLGRKIFGKNWYYYQPAAHMCFFDEASLNTMLNNIGYRIILIKRTSLLNQLKPLMIQLLRYLGIKRFLMPQQLNEKKMYLNKRAKLKDMFLVVAVKK